MGVTPIFNASTTTSTTTKKTTAVLCTLACLAALVVAEPRFRALQKEEARLGCSQDDLKKCEAEIMEAVKDCTHISNMDDIMTCINDILAATDCQKCICDVIPFLC